MYPKYLAHSEVFNNVSKRREERQASATLARDLSLNLEQTNFLSAYVDFGPTWVELNSVAFRLTDTLTVAFETSATEFFAEKDPGSSIEFEGKLGGMMAGTIVVVRRGELCDRFYMKTFHREGSSNSVRYEPNLVEMLVYRILHHIGAGPDVFFPHYVRSNKIYFILTKEVEGLQEYNNMADEETKRRLLVEAYALKLVLNITDLHEDNFGVNATQTLSVIDFCPPIGKQFPNANIVKTFNTGDRLEQLSLRKMLGEISEERRTEIGRVALQRWAAGFRTISTGLIEDEKGTLSAHGLRLEDGSCDLEEYVKTTKENYENLLSGL